jgi:hypothetical protein
MKLLIASLFAFSSAALAANIVPVSYHEGTLVSFSMPASGSNCAVSSKQSCSDVHRTQYMVKSEGILYALTPVNITGALRCIISRLEQLSSFEMTADISSSKWVTESRSIRPLRHDNKLMLGNAFSGLAS